MNGKIIAWQHLPYEFDTFTKQLTRPDINDEIFDEDDDDAEFDEEYGAVMQPQFAGVVVPAMGGLYRVDNELNPLRMFELWMGDTNFDITKDVALKINKVPGVEVLKILTRYKFLVGVGTLFTMTEVRRAIELATCDTTSNDYLVNQIENENLKEHISNKITELRNENKCWAIFLCANGEYETADENTFDELVPHYRKVGNILSGAILIEEDNR